MQFISFKSAGQMTMPDFACTGETRHYYVIPSPAPGSTYTWWLDGKVMSGFNASEFIHTWNSPKKYLLEVQEISADGCPGPRKSGEVFVSPSPEIQVNVSDTLIYDGERVAVSVRNPTGLIWGKWTYELIVEPEAGITGNTINGIYSSPADLHETLFNNDTAIHKVVYRFIPRIVTDDGVEACEGKEVIIIVWVYPGFRYKEGFLEIPDAFSPNGDGINDVWNIKGIHLYPYARIRIFNRWGQSIWESGAGYPVPWNGRRRGEDLPIDSYHYYIDLKNGTKPLIGDVTIVR
jgi:gliding motility-associated-like protein